MSRGNLAFRSSIVVLIGVGDSTALVPGIWNTAMTAAGLPSWRPIAL